MDWNLVIAIVGILIVGIIAFIFGFCAGTSFGRLEEHKAVTAAFKSVLARLDVTLEAKSEEAKTA